MGPLGLMFRKRARASALTAVLIFAVAIGLAVAGEATAALLAAFVGGVAAVPAGLSAAAKPRAALAWQGGYAEPGRTERPPGEPAATESAEPNSPTGATGRPESGD